MHISRAPVREALKRLAEDHLVVLVPRSGCFVAELSKKEIEEIYEIRRRLETMALEYGFEKLDRSRLAQLKSKFITCLTINEPKRSQKEVKLDTQLHQLISQSSQCPNLEEMLGKLRARIQVFRIREALTPQWATLALKEHIEILTAIIKGDKEESIRLLGEHIENTKQTILDSITDEE
jgi:DNA-binding GntR family transcriptional regulator